MPKRRRRLSPLGLWGSESMDKISAPGSLGKNLYEGFTGAADRNVCAAHQQRDAVGGTARCGRDLRPARRCEGAPAADSRTTVRLSRVGIQQRDPSRSGLYKPIWEYDDETLLKDLGPHLAYGSRGPGVSNPRLSRQVGLASLPSPGKRRAAGRLRSPIPASRTGVYAVAGIVVASQTKPPSTGPTKEQA